MSLDMTVGARDAALDSTDEIETQTSSGMPVWLADQMMVVAATALGVMLCSALGVLLFLR